MPAQTYSEETLNQMCKDYQKILNIQDWTIEVNLVDQATIEGHYAQARIVERMRQARILIPTPETFNPHPVRVEQNMRVSLLHELVHIVFAFADPQYKGGSLKDDLWEAAIDSVAHSLDSLLAIADAFAILQQKAQEAVENTKTEEAVEEAEGEVNEGPEQVQSE